MSEKMIIQNPDLKKLRDSGYELSIRGGYLVIDNIPYVNNQKQICFGRIISALDLAGENTTRPQTHVVYFDGEMPCHNNGTEIQGLKHQDQLFDLGEGGHAKHSFSNKPQDGYTDYFHKMDNYIRIISSPASSLDKSITPKTFKVIAANDNEESIFHYYDTNASRSEFSSLLSVFRKQKIAIIGLGGTGSYILDLVSKTPVQEIHLYDSDLFLQHNAFRSPGAASIDELNMKQRKVDYLKSKYSHMHKNIVAHPEKITESNLNNLLSLNFVFIAIDKGEIKKEIFNFLTQQGIDFVDVGMGLERVENSIIGQIRTTMATSKKNDHLKDRVSFSDEKDELYSSNIQIAELNALNASFAVLKWKKINGFYQDLEKEYNSCFSINVNQLTSSDCET